MKKEELIVLGIEEEVAKKIMAINGTDIENAKAKAGQATEKVSQELENLKSQISEKDKLIEEANSQIENFKGMDIEGIKKAADDYKLKYEQSAADLKVKEAEYQKQIQEQQYGFKLNEAVSGLKFPNEFVKKAFLEAAKSKKLPLEGDKILGFEDYVKEFDTQNPGTILKETPSNEPPAPQFTTSTTQTTTPKAKIGLMEAMKRANAGEKIDFSQIAIGTPKEQ